MHDIIYNLNLVVATIEFTVSVIFTLLFYIEWKKQARTKNEQYIPFALMLLYLGLSIAFFMTINSNFFIDPALLALYIETKIYFFLVLTFSVIIIGIFVYVGERIIKNKTRHLFLLYFAFVAALYYVFKIINVPNLGYYIALLIPIGFLIVLLVYYLVWKASGQMRQKMIIFIIGYILFLIAIMQIVQVILFDQYIIPFEIKTLVLIATILSGYSFYSIPSGVTEFYWAKKIRHLYMLTPQGICIFQKPFKTKSITDEDLFGGSLIAIQSLMQEMIKSEKMLRVIDHEDAKIIFKQGIHVIAIMVADEDLSVVQFKLEKLLKEFEMIFGALMETWSGELNLFKPLDAMVNRIFDINQA